MLAIFMLALVAAGKTILNDAFDPDTFWHLQVAQQLLHDGVGPINDTLSFNSIDRPWTPYSWLGELFMLLIWNLGGWRLSVLVDALMAGMTVVFVAMSCRIVSGKFLASIVATALALILLLPMQSFRPVSVVLLLMAASVWLLLRDREQKFSTRAVWCVPVIMLLATNIHLYAFVLLMIVACAAFDAWPTHPRRAIALVVMCAIALLMTPMLPGVIDSAVNYAQSDPMVANGLIAEMSPIYAGWVGMVITLIIIASVLMVWIRAEGLIGRGWLIAIILCLGLSLWLGRFQTVLAIVLAPALACLMSTLGDSVLSKPKIRVVLALLVGLMLMRIVAGFPDRNVRLSEWANRNDDLHDAKTGSLPGGVPELAAAFVEASVVPRHGKLINEFTDGGFIAWRLPKFQVFMDGRTNVHPPEFWTDVFLSDATAKDRRVSRYAADAAILPGANSRLRASLDRLGWRVAFTEPRAVVMLPPE